MISKVVVQSRATNEKIYEKSAFSDCIDGDKTSVRVWLVNDLKAL